MIKIYMNARFLTQTVTGVQRYAIELVKEIDRLIDQGAIDSKQYQFHLLSPNNVITKLELKHISHRVVGKLKGHLWEQFELPFYSRGGMLINMCNTGPAFKKTKSSPFMMLPYLAPRKVFPLPFVIGTNFCWHVWGSPQRK